MSWRDPALATEFANAQDEAAHDYYDDARPTRAEALADELAELDGPERAEAEAAISRRAARRARRRRAGGWAVSAETYSDDAGW